MAKFCRYCGNPVSEGAKFCRNCGRSLAKKTVPQAADAGTGPKTDPAPVHADPVLPGMQKSAVGKHKKAQNTAALTIPAIRRDLQKKAGALLPDLNSLTASADPGQIDCGEPDVFGPGQAAQVLSPLRGLLQTFGSFLDGILGIFKDPKALIGTVILAALWFVLARFRDSDSGIIRILSKILYAEGGYGRSTTAGAAAGVLGKGTVAAALVSLFTGGLPAAFRGIPSLFRTKGEKRSFLFTVLGLLVGAGTYIIFVGMREMPQDTVSVGIAGALLSLEALGNRNSAVYSLARSLTAKLRSGKYFALNGRCDSLISGAALGFALAAAVSALGVTGRWL